MKYEVKILDEPRIFNDWSQVPASILLTTPDEGYENDVFLRPCRSAKFIACITKPHAVWCGTNPPPFKFQKAKVGTSVTLTQD